MPLGTPCQPEKLPFTFIYIHLYSPKMVAYNRKQNFTLTTHKNSETHLLLSIPYVCNFDIDLFLCGTLKPFQNRYK